MSGETKFWLGFITLGGTLGTIVLVGQAALWWLCVAMIPLIALAWWTDRP